jgi:spermidine/putrescine transport system substrate-binding protein
MSDVPREAIMMAAYYLFGTIEALADPKKMDQVFELMLKQKKWVKIYTDSRADDLLISGVAPVVLGMAPDIWRAARENNDIDFVIPQEGSFVVIDSFVLPAKTAKDAMVYKFLDFLYQKEVMQYHMEKYGICPAVSDVTPEGSGSFCPSGEQFKKLHFFQNVASEKKLNEMWIKLMAY